MARRATELLLEAYGGYAEEFRLRTRRAIDRFAARDWAGLKAAAESRLLLYQASLTDLLVKLGRLSLERPIPLAAVRGRFADAVTSRPDAEIAITYYNSAVRRLNGTQGVDERIEFLDLSPPRLSSDGATRSARFGPDHLVPAIDEALGSLGLAGWRDRASDAARIAARLRRDLPSLDGGGELVWLPAPLIRNRRAFLVGRIDDSAGSRPAVVSLTQADPGLTAEALVTTVDDASIVFGFTRSYFQAELERPRAAVAFLTSLLPAKRLDELYTVVGYHRHGKREFYQALHRTLVDPAVRFEPIEGAKGMVMIAFVLKPLNAVFKLVRDRAMPPKQVTRDEVTAKYDFVFLQEHGGRLADTQVFHGMALPRGAFAAPVLEEILTDARDTVRGTGDRLVFTQLYTERRMTPLDVYLRGASPEEAEAAVIDYGRAIKELAAVNVFPGDMLPKNFGVTRHGRIVFYDYDEISSLAECRFRTIPPPRSYEDEVAGEPWFSVGPHDIFPEELEQFIRFPDPLHQTFRRHHADLFTAEFWSGIRSRVRQGEITEPAPYRPEHRLP